MRCRTVFEVADERGRWAITDWLSKDNSVTTLDCDFIDGRINKIELNEAATQNSKWVKKLTGTKLAEMLFETGGKAIRIHCVRSGTNLVMFNGYVKKGETDSGMIREAEGLCNLWKGGKLDVRPFPHPYRT